MYMTIYTPLWEIKNEDFLIVYGCLKALDVFSPAVIELEDLKSHINDARVVYFLFQCLHHQIFLLSKCIQIFC